MNTLELRFEIGINIQTVEPAWSALVAALQDSSDVTLRLAAEGEFDLTLGQLIEAARRTAGQTGKSLRLAEPASGTLRAMLERGGFVADAVPESRAFWLHEDLK
jgi:hypothetical protein